jgi:hypothetical protein
MSAQTVSEIYSNSFNIAYAPSPHTTAAWSVDLDASYLPDWGSSSFSSLTEGP